MKKSLLLSLFSLSVIGASAQITLTMADIATPTKVIRQAYDTIPTIVPGSAGASQTWNFSVLSDDKEDTLTFLPYSAAPNPKFSTANIAVRFGVGTTFAYLNNSASNAQILGSAAVQDFGGGPSQVNSVNTPGEKLANWPATYMSGFSNNYRTTSTFYYGVDPGIGVSIDSLRTHGTTAKNAVYDAWGTLTTPLGTYNVIRQKQTTVKRDSTDAFIMLLGGWQNDISTNADSSSHYSWWANGIGFPMVEMDIDSFGTVTSATWLQSLPMTVGVSEYTAVTDVNVFPNPAQDEVNFLVDAAVAKGIMIFDIAGRKVAAAGINGSVTTVSTSSYANGAYTYSITGQDGSVISRGKFSVAR